MKRLLLLLFITGICSIAFSANGGVFSLSDSLAYKKCLLKRFPPGYDSTNNHFYLRNEKAKFGRKVLLASGLSFGYNGIITALLFALPENVSRWSKSGTSKVNQQYRNTFSAAPVIDKDHWYINYLGHPYQGACYYNSIRSQGAKFWQAGLFAIGHSLIWEYAIEGGMEQPSVQDLIVTPLAGSLLGELIHFGTVRMSRNGFRWYEKAFVCVFNPMFAINNGFKYAGKISAP